MHEILDCNGGNDYNLPNYSKAGLAHQGLLPRCSKPLNNLFYQENHNGGNGLQDD